MPHTNVDNPTPLLPQELRPAHFLGFTYGVVAVFLCLYIFPIALLRLPGFEQWEVSEQAVDIDYTFVTPHLNGDVVLMGESSALFGVDPQQISSSLGLKVLNLGNTLQTLPVTGRLELDRYLAQNKRPRLLVFYLAPWDLDFSRSTLGRYIGEEMLLRHGSVADILYYSRGHALEMLTFPFKFYAANSLFNPARRRWPPATNRSVIQQSGHAPLGPYKPLEPSCAFPDHILHQIGETATIVALLHTYQGAADNVVLFIAPIPHCKGYEVVMNGPYTQLGTAPPNVLPTHDFGDDTFFAHPVAASVPVVTQQLTQAVQAYLQTHAGGASAP